MKKIIIVLFTLFIGISVNAQKIKIKKDIIYKDKVEIGRTEGSLMQSNGEGIKVFGLNNELIMTIVPRQYSYNNPLYKDIRWYDITFGDSNKKFMLNVKNSTTSSRKYVIRGLMDEYGFNIDGTIIKNQDEIISKNDNIETFVADTTKIREEEAVHIAMLNNNKILRDKEKTVKFITNDEGNYDIIQDNTVIGSLERKNQSSAGNVVSTTYWFSERFHEPQGDEKLMSNFAAYTKIKAGATTCEVFTFADKKTHKVKIKDSLKAETDILKMLLAKKYL